MSPTPLSAPRRAALALAVALLTAAPAAADAVRWSHLDGTASARLASGPSSCPDESNVKRTSDLAPGSWWGNDSSWNRYAYVQGNPLKYVDPEGEVIKLVSLTSEQEDELLKKLNQFTGNTYGVDENGNLALISTGENSSATATAFLNGLIAAEKIYNVVATQGVNRWNHATGNVELNFNSFNGANYGKVNPATFNLGSTLVHELYHSATGAKDLAPSGVRTDRLDWTGPVVDFVNVIRAERGLPLRAAYNAQKTAFGDKERFFFKAVDPRRPEKIFYVVRKIYGK